jgi:hypothetical protein
MPKIEIRINSLNIAAFNFETQEISAKNGPEFPVLMIPYDLQLYAYEDPNEPGTPVHPVTCVYLAGELWSLPQQKVAVKSREELAYCAPVPGSQIASRGYLEFPFDILTVARIEKGRTGDFGAALKFRSLVAIHAPGAMQTVQRFAIAESQTSGFTISRSHWIERILPELGYGRIELLEVRLSRGIARDHESIKALDAIRRARDLLVDGDWDKAVAHCRIAIETIPDSRQLQLNGPHQFDLRVDDFVSDHLVPRLGQEEARFLADGMKSLWRVCTRPARPAASDGFQRPDAEFIVRYTTAIVEYVGSLLN